jgi:hypothetical protein
MKDLTLSTNDTEVVGKIRVDMLSNSPANFTIFEMFDADGNSVDSLDLIGGFYKKISYSWSSFVQFCIDNNLRIDAQDSNGTNAANLLLNQAPEGTTYDIVSADGDTKTILIATNVTAAFAPDDVLVIYNEDNTIFGTFTHVSDSYSAPNTSIVVSETLTDIATESGKYLVNNGQ